MIPGAHRQSWIVDRHRGLAGKASAPFGAKLLGSVEGDFAKRSVDLVDALRWT